MLKLAQTLSGLLALALFAFASVYLFNPSGAASARGFEPIGDYGLTNVRLLAATFITLGVMSAIGGLKKNFVFLAPAALFFLVSIVIRIIGMLVDGADPSTLRVMIPAVVLFAIAEFALQIFKRAEQSEVLPVTA